MLKASGIILLVFFCCISGWSKGLTDSPIWAVGDEWEVPVESLRGKAIREQDIEKVLNLKALKAAQGLSFKPGVAEALANLGRFYFEQGESENALKYFRSYRRVCEELQDSLLLADAFYQLGRLYYHQGLPYMAEEQYLDAVQIANKLKNKSLQAKYYNLLGSLYYSQRSYSLAESNLLKSLSYYSYGEDRTGYAAVLYNLGMVLKARKKYRESLDYLKEAMSILENNRNTADLSTIMTNIGKIYHLYNDYDLAELYYKRALQAAEKGKAIHRMVEAYHGLSVLQAEKEQYRLAYEYQSLLSAYKDTLTFMDQRASEAEVNKKLELERRERVMNQLIKEKELDLLNREYKISKMEISWKNDLIYITGTISLLLGMLAFILYQRYVLNKRKNLQLELQNQHTSTHNKQLQELNSKLKQSEQELKEINDTKDKFFSIISHDLRGPLNTLSGFIRILKKDINQFNQEELNHFSLRMERSLQGVTSLLDNLFQWASAQTGLIEFSPTEFKLLNLVEENLLLLQDTAELKEIRLEYDIPAGLMLYADIQMTRLLLRNLVSNALKFTHKGGMVRIRARAESGWAILQIEDNGIGMSEENRLKLINEKTVYTQRGTENEKGSGLGLLLCKDFVAMHKGRIEVESALGKGTTFSISLPLYVPSMDVKEEIMPD